jgi:hypothetical protein
MKNENLKRFLSSILKDLKLKKLNEALWDYYEADIEQLHKGP